jgi:hypothetical protein
MIELDFDKRLEGGGMDRLIAAGREGARPTPSSGRGQMTAQRHRGFLACMPSSSNLLIVRMKKSGEVKVKGFPRPRHVC